MGQNKVLDSRYVVCRRMGVNRQLDMLSIPRDIKDNAGF